MKKRMLSQDIAKGIGILVVVQVHTLQLTPAIGYVIAILLGYVMPFFLFISGYNYRSKEVPAWKTMAVRVWGIVKTLLVYSFGVFVVMGTYFIIRNEVTIFELIRSYAAFLMSKWGAQMIGWQLPQVLFQRLLGPLWFLQFLATASIVFYLTVDWALRSGKHLVSTVTLLSGISMILIELNVILPWGIQNAPAIAALMILGAWLKKVDGLFVPTSKPSWVWINCLVVLVIITLVQLRWPGAGFVGAGALGEAAGGAEVFIMMAFGILGTYLLINISKLIEKCSTLSKGLIWLGRHTLQILCLHMSVMHIIKDILSLPQTNAAESTFVDHIIPGNILAYVLTVVVVVLMIMLFEKIKTHKLATNNK